MSELLQPISELNIANIEVYRKILSSEAITLTIPDNITLSEN